MNKLDIKDYKSGCFEMISLEDIARGLSNICRFGGQRKQFYSVAHHSMLVAVLAPNELRLYALLHDASEAYLGDVVKPLKHILGNSYAILELKSMAAIANNFKLNLSGFDKIKEYDMQALLLEDVMLKGGSMQTSTYHGKSYYFGPSSPENAHWNYSTMLNDAIKWNETQSQQ